jgi:hypothetical protein
MAHFVKSRPWVPEYKQVKKKNEVTVVVRTAVFCALEDNPGSIPAFPLLA